MKNALLIKNRLTVLLSFISTFFACSSDPIGPLSPPQCNYKIEVIAGNYQNGAGGTILNDSVKVKVTDLDGLGVRNVSILFSTLSGGGRFLESSKNTNNDGTASVKLRVGSGIDNIYSAFVRDVNGIGTSVFIFANTELRLNLKWSTGLYFYTNFKNKEKHDGRVLESDNFLIFSDRASDDNKIIFLKIAEEHLLSLKKFFNVESSSELKIYSSESNSKIKIFAYVNSSFNPGTYYGVANYGITFPSIERYDYQRKGIKHELTHIVELLLIGPENILNCNPPVWWQEGIAEYHGEGVSSTPGVISSLSALNIYKAGHRNPLLIKIWEDFLPGERPSDYYAGFGAVVTYIIDPRGMNKNGAVIKNMYKDLAMSRNFNQSFEKYIGITTTYLEQNLYDLLTAYFSK